MLAPTTVLLLGSEPSLVNPVAGVVAAVPGLSLEVLPEAAGPGARLAGEDVALALIHLPEGGGTERASALLRLLAAGRRRVATLVLAERHHPEQELALLRQGAADYLSRPLDLGRFAYLVNVLTLRARSRAAARPAAGPKVETVGQGEAFLYAAHGDLGRVMEHVARVAPRDTTVLLLGDTGTGKTRLARLIHELSDRRSEPFLVLPCGALASGLLESELFGHVKGAFTSADRDRAGKLAEAGRGTLLLDDIDALPPDVQAKLLRVVEDRVFEPVGSNQLLPLRARLVVASSRDLAAEVAAGRFRNDLYYRLNVVSFYLLPLRERPTVVIEAIARQFLGQYAAWDGGLVKGLTPEALEALLHHSWPGNLRELRNAIERAVALCAGEVIEVEDLPAPLWAVAPPAASRAPSAVPEGAGTPPGADRPAEGTLSQAKQEAEAARIVAALERHNNNRLRAAAELGVSRMTLYKKLHRYGILGSVG
jgi:two-component system response regulator HydG